MMKLKYVNGIYWLKTTYERRQEPLNVGFKWNKAKKLFFTRDPSMADKFLNHAVDRHTFDTVVHELDKVKKIIQKSEATTSDMDIPKPDGLEFYPFQKAGIEFALERKNTLLADQMGLGKTLEVIGVINCTQPDNVLIICPASIKLNWLRELDKWLVHYYPIGVAYGNKPFPEDSIVIINYDILKKFHNNIHFKKWDLLAVDECHYLRNPTTIRTLEVVGFPKDKIEGIKAERKLFLTGTPIVNRPKDLFNSLHYLAPKDFPSFWKYAVRYCGGYQAGYGWDFDGASNLEELYLKLRTTVMIRRLKKDVLKELPDKQRQIIELPANGDLKTALKAENKKIKNYKQQVRELGIDVFTSFAELAKIRHETALAKVPMVVQHLNDIVDSGEKVVCFAWHRDVVGLIREAFPKNSVAVTGATALSTRQVYIDTFQKDPAIKVFIGNIIAAGTGITLTAASRVVFAELDWVPGNVTQAEDRCHRIGQENSVHVQHLVLEGSVDAIIAKVLVKKQIIIDKAIDGKGVIESKLAKEILTDLFNHY